MVIKNMEEKVLNLIGKECSIMLLNDDSYIGVVKRLEFNEYSKELRISFEVESGKGLIIPISQIKSIVEVE